MDILPPHDDRYAPPPSFYPCVVTESRRSFVIGWFLLLTSMLGYFRVKRFEMSVRASRTSGPPALTAEDVQRDIALRRNLEEVFGISVAYESEGAAAAISGSRSAN